MRKTRAKNANPKQGKPRERLSLEKEIDQLATTVVDVGEEMELVSEEGSSLEDIEGAKVLAAEVLDKYSALMKRLSPNVRKELQQSIGHGVEQIRGKLMQLKEAPE